MAETLKTKQYKIPNFGAGKLIGFEVYNIETFAKHCFKDITGTRAYTQNVRVGTKSENIIGQRRKEASRIFCN